MYKTPDLSLSASLLTIMLLMAPIQSSYAKLYITIIQGLSGEVSYEESFSKQNHLITLAANSITDVENIFSFSGEEASREDLLAHFSNLSSTMTDNDRAAIYLIGHGSFDGEQYKFNIPGPDLSNEDLNNVLATFPGRNHFLLNTSSASGALLETLEDDSRILITATRNGIEKNTTEFGTFFATALTDDTADINKNNSISIQEAFDYTERKVADFFEDSGRLATEHPQIRGEGAAQFNLARINLIEIDTEDPILNQLLEQRTALDGEIEDLQLRRREFSNADYIKQLQALILESATITEQINQLDEGANGDGQ